MEKLKTLKRIHSKNPSALSAKELRDDIIQFLRFAGFPEKFHDFFVKGKTLPRLRKIWKSVTRFSSDTFQRVGCYYLKALE